MKAFEKLYADTLAKLEVAEKKLERSERERAESDRMYLLTCDVLTKAMGGPDTCKEYGQNSPMPSISNNAAACITRLLKENADLERWRQNIGQDICEGALVPTSLLDATRQALHEVARFHPALDNKPPSYGVWEMLRKEVDRLRLECEKFRKDYAIFEEVSPPDVKRSTFAEWCFYAWSREDERKQEIERLQLALKAERDDALKMSLDREELQLRIQDLERQLQNKCPSDCRAMAELSADPAYRKYLDESKRPDVMRIEVQTDPTIKRLKERIAELERLTEGGPQLNESQKREISDYARMESRSTAAEWIKTSSHMIEAINDLMRQAYAAGKKCCCPGCEAWTTKQSMTPPQRQRLTKLAKRVGRFRLAEHILPSDEKTDLRKPVIRLARLAEEELCKFVDKLLSNEETSA